MRIRTPKKIGSLGATLKEASSDARIHAIKLIEAYSKASRNDCFALALAEQEQCSLLTGDKALIAADKEKAMVKGTVWFVKQLVMHQKINV